MLLCYNQLWCSANSCKPDRAAFRTLRSAIRNSLTPSIQDQGNASILSLPALSCIAINPECTQHREGTCHIVLLADRVVGKFFQMLFMLADVAQVPRNSEVYGVSKQEHIDWPHNWYTFFPWMCRCLHVMVCPQCQSIP